MSELLSEHQMMVLIAVLGAVVFLTRIGGYLIISQFGQIHPRVEKALGAVPAAVIATLVFPAAHNKGLLEITTIIIVGLACLRLSTIWALLLGLGFLIAGRQLIGV